MNESAQREEIRFASGRTECAAWHYPGGNGGCVVMAGGFGVTKEPGTDLFAARFHRAGFSVLAFDPRCLGGSGGRPRGVLRTRWQIADWQAAIACAARLPEVDPERVALWSFSLSGGLLLRVAARTSPVAAVVAQTPAVDGWATSRNAAGYQRPLAMARLTLRGVWDAAGAAVGAPCRTVPLAGPPGTVAVLTTPDSLDGPRALDPDGRHGDWPQVVAARSALAATVPRPVRDAARVRCPLLVVVCEQDRSAPPGPAVRAARRAPRGELVRLPGGHYAPFLDAHEQAVAAELSFLRRHLLGVPAAASR